MSNTLKKNPPLRIHVVVYEAAHHVVAQCLQIDQAAQGNTAESALETLEDCLAANMIQNIKNKERPFENLCVAPDHIWKKADTYKRISRRSVPHLNIMLHVCYL